MKDKETQNDKETDRERIVYQEEETAFGKAEGIVSMKIIDQKLIRL